jgi:hypothetical protein
LLVGGRLLGMGSTSSMLKPLPVTPAIINPISHANRMVAGAAELSQRQSRCQCKTAPKGRLADDAA